MSSDWFYKFDTLSLHAGQRPDPTTGARAVPVHNSTSYVFRDTDHAAGLFNLEEAGHIYSRISNPTVAVFEERIAALEGGVGAVATASGQSAFHLAAATILSAGDHVVSSAAIYGGTHNLLNHTLRRFGIETTFVEPTDPANFRRAARPEHEAVLRRDDRQPADRRAGHPSRRRARPRTRRAAPDRQHLRHAVPVADRSISARTS